MNRMLGLGPLASAATGGPWTTSKMTAAMDRRRRVMNELGIKLRGPGVHRSTNCRDGRKGIAWHLRPGRFASKHLAPAMANTSVINLRKGHAVRHNNDVCIIAEMEHKKPPRMASYVQMTI